MPRYVTIIHKEKLDTWFFVIEDGIIVWGQYCWPRGSDGDSFWYDSHYSEWSWMRVKEAFAFGNDYLIEEEE
jgi:hypothetical protein